MALVGGRAGRRAAAAGLVALAVDSAVVNIGLKVAARRRRRPDRDSAGVPAVRRVPMPQSASFPSGHTASGFAFMNAVAHTLPAAAGPLGLLASAVGYSRIHTGVHYPGDVVGPGGRRTVPPSTTRRCHCSRRAIDLETRFAPPDGIT